MQIDVHLDDVDDINIDVIDYLDGVDGLDDVDGVIDYVDDADDGVDDDVESAVDDVDVDDDDDVHVHVHVHVNVHVHVHVCGCMYIFCVCLCSHMFVCFRITCIAALCSRVKSRSQDLSGFKTYLAGIRTSSHVLQRGMILLSIDVYDKESQFGDQ